MQLYLIIDLSVDHNCTSLLEKLLTNKIASCVLLQNCTHFSDLKAHVELIQAHNVAALLDDSELVKKLNADGLHLSSDQPQDYLSMRQQLGKDLIIGIKADRSRHNLMVVAEQNADYVAIDLKRELNQKQQTNNHQWAPSLSWWNEMFETPCVAWDISSLEQIELVKQAGADFLAIKLHHFKEDESFFEKLEQFLDEK